MLKFVKHHLESIAGIEIYPLISLVIFFVFFVGLTYFVIKADKKTIDEISKIPLDPKNDNDEKS